MSFPERETPAISGRRLSRLLTRWADARRLDPHRVDAIKVAARTAPADLGFDWWWRLLDPDTGSVFGATSARSASFRPAGRAVEPPFSMGTSDFTAWPEEDIEYQPYLRLA